MAEVSERPTISVTTPCTSVMCFVDMNVLIHAVSAAEEESHKRERAVALIAQRDLALSVQVLQEFYVQATRPSRPGGLTHDEAVNFIEALLRFPVQAMTLEVMRTAFTICNRFGLILLGQRHPGRGTHPRLRRRGFPKI